MQIGSLEAYGTAMNQGAGISSHSKAVDKLDDVDTEKLVKESKAVASPPQQEDSEDAVKVSISPEALALATASVEE